MDNLSLVAMILVTIGITSFLSAGIGHLSGYRTGFKDGSNKEAGKWKDRIEMIYRKYSDE